MTLIKIVFVSVVLVCVSADLISDLCKDCEKCQGLSPRWRSIACRDYFNSLQRTTSAKWNNLLTLRRLKDEQIQVMKALVELGLNYDGRKIEIHTYCGEFHDPTYFRNKLGWTEDDLSNFLGDKSLKKLYLRDNDL